MSTGRPRTTTWMAPVIRTPCPSHRLDLFGPRRRRVAAAPEQGNRAVCSAGYCPQPYHGQRIQGRPRSPGRTATDRRLPTTSSMANRSTSVSIPTVKCQSGRRCGRPLSQPPDVDLSRFQAPSQVSAWRSLAMLRLTLLTPNCDRPSCPSPGPHADAGSSAGSLLRLLAWVVPSHVPYTPPWDPRGSDEHLTP